MSSCLKTTPFLKFFVLVYLFHIIYNKLNLLSYYLKFRVKFYLSGLAAVNRTDD